MKHIEFINALGGPTEVSRICGITKSAVSQWKARQIPRAQLNFLKTKFPKEYKRVFGIKP